MPHRTVAPFDTAPFLPSRRLPTPVAGAVQAGHRIFLSAQSALRSDGVAVALGDPSAQADAALDSIEAALSAAGGTLSDITRLTTCLVDRAHRKPVYDAIGRRLHGVFPVSTGLIVAGLPLPELMVQIDAEAVVDTKVTRHRTFGLHEWFGQDIAWRGAMAAITDEEIFFRGQTGAALDGSRMAGPGRQAEDAAAQAELALSNLGMLLRECDSSMDEVCKITVHIGDRGYRSAVYPVIGRHFGDVRPVSTGLIMSGFARPEILFEIDAQVIRKRGGPHARIRPYHSDTARYGVAQQNLGCKFCMATRAGSRVILRGQTGTDLNDVMHGIGDAAAQAEQAMENVGVLLEETGAQVSDVVKATVFVTDRAFLAGVTEVVLRHLRAASPAFGAIVVKGLASPELLMEVDVTAVTTEVTT